jgi:rhodanese-related sulfurtransferase
MAATMLRTLGYTNVRNLAGGIVAWVNADLPLVGVPFDMQSLLQAYYAGLTNRFNAVKADEVAVALAENPDLLLVDVRTGDEFVDGHIEGAINVPLVELTDHLDMLPDLEQPLVVYCGSGHRSAMGMVALNLLGYQNAVSMLGGVKAWMEADLPVTTEETAYEAGVAPEFDSAVLEAIDAYVKAIPAGYYTISADDLNIALIEDQPALIDVRTDSELESGYIEGAVQIELSTFMERVDEWPTDKGAPVVVYCGSGHRSVMAMVAMQLMGYEDVKSLVGGFGAWVAKDYPVLQVQE